MIADSRTGYSRRKGCEYTSGLAFFGEAIWYKLPKTADLTELDDRCRTAIWLEKSDRSDEHIIGLENGAVLARSVRRKVEGKRWNERALNMVTGTAWNPRPEEVVARRRYVTRVLMERYGPTEDCEACFRECQQHTERCRARFALLRGNSTRSSSTESHLNVNGSTDRWSRHGCDGVRGH